MRLLSLLAALAVLPLAGCDGGGGGDNCAEFGFRSAGTLTASVDGQPLRADCYNVFAENGLTYITGYGFGDSATDLRSPIALVIGGASSGAYEINGDDPTDVSTAQISPGGEFGGSGEASRAESGEILVTSYSETQLRGTFNFVTESGVRVSVGVFDLDVAGLL